MIMREKPDPEFVSLFAPIQPQNLLVYVTWQNILLWKRETSAAIPVHTGETRRPFPYAFGGSQPVFKKYAKKDSTVWVVTCPRYGTYCLAPSLIARLRVKEQVERGSERFRELRDRIPEWFPEAWTHISVADTNPAESSYFALNNAYECLTSLDFTNDRLDQRITMGEHIVGESRPPRISRESASNKPGEVYSELPKRLRFVRRLFPGEERKLVRFSESLGKKRKVFISYARQEKRQEDIGALVECLIARGYSPWLDMKSIPDDVAQGRRKVNEAVLLEMLHDGIRQSNLFIAVVGPEYLQSSWCLSEWEAARAEHADRPSPMCALVSMDGHTIGDETCDGNLRRIFEFGNPGTTGTLVDRWFSSENP